MLSRMTANKGAMKVPNVARGVGLSIRRFVVLHVVNRGNICTH